MSETPLAVITPKDLPETTAGDDGVVKDEAGTHEEVTAADITVALETVATIRALDSTADLPKHPKEDEAFQVRNVTWVWVKGQWVSRQGIYGFEEFDAVQGNDSTRAKTFDAMYPDAASGSPKRIVISGFDATDNPAREEQDADSIATQLVIVLQNGAVPEVGLNGVTLEDLAKVQEIVLEGFQEGRFACAENEKMLFHVRAILALSKARTARRQAEGTEGTHQGN
jgi:hypothetical protein